VLEWEEDEDEEEAYEEEEEAVEEEEMKMRGGGEEEEEAAVLHFYSEFRFNTGRFLRLRRPFIQALSTAGTAENSLVIDKFN